jgi:hypothetical protein
VGRDGKAHWMRAQVESLVALSRGTVSVALRLAPSQPTRSGVELSVDRAMDDPCLEAGVRIAEGYSGGHIANTMEIILIPWFARLEQ